MKLFSLTRRRLRGDLIEVFKQLTGKSDVGTTLLVRNHNPALRGHSLKLDKPKTSTSTRAHFFACRVINDWNKLPAGVVTAPTVREFKRRLDDCWLATFPDTV